MNTLLSQWLLTAFSWLLLLLLFVLNFLGNLIRDNNAIIRFGLSVEEVGLITEQLPAAPIELIRSPPPMTVSPNGGNLPYKVLRITPGVAGSVSFEIDFEKDGVGGQQAGTPMKLEVQLGEFVVIKQLMRESIPFLVGWSTMIKYAERQCMEEARSKPLASSGPMYGRPHSPNYDNGGDVPF